MFARSIGIPVDHRRRNTTVESLQTNVARLQQYFSKLVIFPRKPGQSKKGDATKEETKGATATSRVSALFPIQPITSQPITERKIEVSEKAQSAFVTLRVARADSRNAGQRAKRAKAKEEEAAAKKK